MHWPSHCTAFYAQWIVRFMHPRKSPWKTILRSWIQNEHLRDGTLLSSVDTNNMTNIPTTATYMRRCLKAFQSLNITQNYDLTDESCLGEPLFYNNRFTLPFSEQQIDQWAVHFKVTHIQDLIDISGQGHNDNQWDHFFFGMCPATKRDTQRAHEWVDPRKAELITIRATIPAAIWTATAAPKTITGTYAEIVNTRRATGVIQGLISTIRTEFPE